MVKLGYKPEPTHELAANTAAASLGGAAGARQRLQQGEANRVSYFVIFFTK